MKQTQQESCIVELSHDELLKAIQEYLDKYHPEERHPLVDVELGQVGVGQPDYYARLTFGPQRVVKTVDPATISQYIVPDDTPMVIEVQGEPNE